MLMTSRTCYPTWRVVQLPPGVFLLFSSEKTPAGSCTTRHVGFIEKVRTSEKVYRELFTSKKKEESKRKVLLGTWKMPKLL